MCVSFGWRTFLFCGVNLCSIKEGEMMKATTEYYLKGRMKK